MMFGFEFITIKQVDFKKAPKLYSRNIIRYARFGVWIDKQYITECFSQQSLLELIFFRMDGYLWVSADREALKSHVTIEERIKRAIWLFIYQQYSKNSILKWDSFIKYAKLHTVIQILSLKFTRKHKKIVKPTNRIEHLRFPQRVVFEYAGSILRNIANKEQSINLNSFRVILNGFDIIRLLTADERRLLCYWNDKSKTMLVTDKKNCVTALKAYLKHHWKAHLDYLSNLQIDFINKIK